MGRNMESRVKGNKCDYQTFLKFYKQKMKKPADMDQPMRNAFEALDKEGFGNIREAELRQILTTLGEPLSYKDMDLLLRDVGVDEDGNVRYDDFVDVIVK